MRALPVRLALVAAAILYLAGCGAPEPRLQIGERIPLPHPAAATISVLDDGRLAIGQPGGLLLGMPGEKLQLIDLDTEGVPRVVGEAAGRILISGGQGSLIMLDGQADTVAAVRQVLGLPLLDVRGRRIFAAGGGGEVMLYEPDSLALVSAWAALGSPATAIAASPEGDRIYLALERDGGSTILTRDLQTGRVLRQTEFTAPFSTLIATADGDLIGLLGAAADAALVSLRPWGAELELRWRERLERGTLPASVRLSRSGQRVVIISHADNKHGLRVFDAETGTIIGSLQQAPLDAAYAPDGRLLLLFPGEVSVVR